MGKQQQLIISVSREYGSGGHSIAQIIAEEFGLPLYDYNLLTHMAEGKHVNVDELKKYDELPRLRVFSKTVKGYTNSPALNLAMAQFDYIKKLANEGNSFVIVGRCAESVLKGNKALISIFILGDMKDKIANISKEKNLSHSKAENLIFKTNKKRKRYHNYFCETAWGDSRNYDISINSSRLGYERTAEFLIKYIKERTAGKKNH
ncbi:MAG: cytidylate kinase-like family protein [Clostridiales bacterium]|nr:cytidylate kinase-like family protein [Clostridiales bacterium]